MGHLLRGLLSLLWELILNCFVFGVNCVFARCPLLRNLRLKVVRGRCTVSGGPGGRSAVSAVGMVGERPTLQDILLTEQPQAVDLVCDEELGEEEEQQVQQGEDLFQVEIQCPLCDSPLRFCVRGTPESVRQFHQLLLDNLGFLCLNCYRHHRNG